MRRLRTLAWVTIAVLLGLLPGAVFAAAPGTPTEPGTSTDGPLALQPTGRPPLQGTPWRLEGYRHRGIERVPGPEVAAWMRLGPATVTASGGCTTIEGSYSSVGRAVTFRVRPQRESDCAEQTALVQRAMHDGLRRAASFEVIRGSQPAGDTLLLRSATGVELLRFGLDDIGRLDQADWRLASYTADGRTIPASAEQPAILSFQPRRDDPVRRTSVGPATGSTGCNGVVAEFRRRADVLRFADLQRTDAPCTPLLAAQEQAMVAVLQATSLMLSLLPDELRLASTDTGEQLVFVSQRPLEGTTWLLRADAQPADPRATVTLMLHDGAAEGEGPCGRYGASYATDGLFITFSGVAAASADTCGDPGSEQALLAGLRSAVMVERDRSGLRLIDASGRAVLRFTSPTAP
jgi:heat shock protein HslJ